MLYLLLSILILASITIIYINLFNSTKKINNPKKKKQIIISIDGNIGSGKSTIIKLLKKKFGNKVYIAAEPVDKWVSIKDSVSDKNLLELFYEDKKRWSYTFQNYAYITRIMNLTNAINSGAEIIITERSVETDREIFAKMLLDDKDMSNMEMEMYKTWFNRFNINIDAIVYLKTSVNNCLSRIEKRNRNGEDKIPNEYINSLNKRHDEWLKKKDKKRLLILNGNNDFINNTLEQELIFSKFNYFINSLRDV